MPKPKFTKKTKTQMHLFALIVLFCGFSIYALTSYFNSTNKYINSMYSSVIEGGAPPGCQTCAPVGGSSDSTAPYEIFTDVMSDSTYAVALETLRDEGIISGYSDGSFKPDNLINRAELMTVLTTALNAEFAGKSYDNCFTDVKQEWFAIFVCYAKDQKWVGGYGDGSYRPANPVIKSEALKIVMGAFAYELPEIVTEKPFTDVEITQWYASYAAVAKEKGIVSTATFDAGHQMSRAEFAQMVYNAMKGKDLL